MESSNSLETNIRANIKTLDQYKRFPLQLYQWIHVVDRYLSEITTTVDGFL
jgi:flagellin-like hook-associated protein FlgL